MMRQSLLATVKDVSSQGYAAASCDVRRNVMRADTWRGRRRPWPGGVPFFRVGVFRRGGAVVSRDAGGLMGHGRKRREGKMGGGYYGGVCGEALRRTMAPCPRGVPWCHGWRRRVGLACPSVPGGPCLTGNGPSGRRGVPTVRFWRTGLRGVGRRRCTVVSWVPKEGVVPRWRRRIRRTSRIPRRPCGLGPYAESADAP